MSERLEYQVLRVPVNTGTQVLSEHGAAGWRVTHVTTPPDDRGVLYVVIERPLSGRG